MPPGQCSQRRGLLLELQLVYRAFLRRDVITWPEVDGLVDGSTLREGVEVADFDHSPHLGNDVVGRDGDVTGGSALARGIDQFERHAAPSRVGSADDEGGGLDELELQLRTTGVGASWGVGSIDVLEDDAFRSGEAEFLVGLDLVVGIDCRADPWDVRVSPRGSSRSRAESLRSVCNVLGQGLWGQT